MLHNIPGDRMIDRSIAVGYDIPHQLDLPPRDGRVVILEAFRQITHQFSGLEDTKGHRIAVHRVGPEGFIVTPEMLTAISIWSQ